MSSKKYQTRYTPLHEAIRAVGSGSSDIVISYADHPTLSKARNAAIQWMKRQKISGISLLCATLTAPGDLIVTQREDGGVRNVGD